MDMNRRIARIEPKNQNALNAISLVTNAQCRELNSVNTVKRSLANERLMVSLLSDSLTLAQKGH